MFRRSDLENALFSELCRFGWGVPSLRTQRAAFPGVTPSRSAEGGKGRGAVVYDIERIPEASILLARCAGLKASAGNSSERRQTTIAVTTGTTQHCDAVIAGIRGGLDVPIVIVKVNQPTMIGETLMGFEGIEATTLRFGAAFRLHGIVQRTEGQGKGRGFAAPVAWGRKVQVSKGKRYEYITLQANIESCGCSWVKLDSIEALNGYVEENAEEIIL